MSNFTPEQRLRDRLSETDDFEVITCVCRYIREVLKDYGSEGEIASALVDVIERVVQ